MARTNRALNSAANVAEKAAVVLFRWAATDHINKHIQRGQAQLFRLFT